MVHFDNSTPIYQQVVDLLKKQMARGSLSPGEKLPSGRELSMNMMINSNTVARVYRELEQEGYCFTRRGLGTFVTEDKERVKALKKQMAEAIVENLLKEFGELGLNSDYAIALIKEKEAKHA